MNPTNNIAFSANKRRSYHTNVKFLARLGLLPEETLSYIPKSNISRWKSSDFSDMIGIKSFDSENKRIEDIKLLMQHEKLLKTCTAVLRVKNTLISVLNKKSNRQIKKTEEKKIIVNTIDRVKETISLKRVVRYFKISVTKYYNWAKQTKNKCLQTLIEKCPRIYPVRSVNRKVGNLNNFQFSVDNGSTSNGVYPNQLSKNELQKMSDLLEEEKFKGWPVYSIAWYAIRNRVLNVSVGSWFKYSKLLGFVKDKPKNPKKNYQSLRASRPGEKIHADVTIFRPLDNTKVYIYIVMDNFSRYILSWRASLQLSSEIFVENLKEAFSKLTLNNKPVELIVDGGPENNNEKVNSFITDIDGAIKKLIAQKDIIFSNSLIEAMNRTLKYGFLFQQALLDFAATLRYLEKSIPVYNDERPHYFLNGQTPEEAFRGTGIKKEEYKTYFQEAYTRRIKENREARCKNCSPEAEIKLAMA